MTSSVTPESAIERLAHALSATKLPASAQRAATRLIDRLSSPVRVTLLGPPGAGKSTLRNVLAGAAVIPAGAGLPTTTLRFGEPGKIVATLGNRTKKEITGLDFDALQVLSPAYAEISTPLAVLKKVSLLEVVTDGSPADLMAAAKWAAKRTDIAIWVTTDFSPQEQALWERVPDEVKDHGYLVLNQTDRLSPNDRADYNTRLEHIAAQEFHSFFPTAALQALGAIERNGAEEVEAFRASGCDELIAALMRHVDLGTQADIDSALMFLSRYDASAPKPATPVAASLDAPDAPNDGDSPAKEAAEPTDASPALQIESALSHEQQQDDILRCAAHETALARLRRGAGAMLDKLHSPEPAVAEPVLDHCVETVEELASTLSDDELLTEAVAQASDVIVLLQLEQTESAAEDAVVTLLQLKRDIEVALAA